jgi:excisionase family DNA binding protein
MTDIVAPDAAIEKLYTTKAIAEIFDVTAETVRNWIVTGRLTGTQVNGKQYRVKRADLIAFAKKHYNVNL